MWIALTIIVCIAALLLASLSRGPVQGDLWPLEAKPILTDRERVLFDRLLVAFPSCRIFPQVALSQLMVLKPGTRNWQSIQNQYFRLVADFVVCNADLQVVAVIELDDGTHRQARRAAADARKTKALRSAGLHLCRLSEGTLPSIEELRVLIPSAGQLLPLPDLRVDSDLARRRAAAEAAAMRQPLLNIAVGIVVTLGGFVAYSYFSGNALPLLSRHPAVSKLQPPANMPTSSLPVPSSKRIAPLPATQTDSQALARKNALLEQQKQAAWSVYFKPSPSCEHPPDWAAQVECGNQFMRAKKEFDVLWQAKLSSTSSVYSPE